ncbi:dihydrolipoyl dehydrogenase [Salibacterium aidingense]|uniref:dihydrolipoyl dehydrogenase n=1 Tax=Salibacterium aidingense TaxID=384933 RepID=UPI003BC3CBA3
MPEEYDVVIVGAGTGGYVAAVKAAQEGLKTAVVEKAEEGGTCLHRGCIPSKSLLRSAEMYEDMKNSEAYGIAATGLTLQFDKVQERKNAIVKQLHQGILQLFKKGSIDVYKGIGRILGSSIFSPRSGTISVEMADGSENQMLLPKNVIIATGTRPKALPGLDIDGKKVITSDHALHLEELPSSIIIVGGGVIGVEFASMLSDFEVDVTIVEYASCLLPQEDHDISAEIERRLKRRGVQIYTSTSVVPHKTETADNISVTVEQENKELELQAEKVLVCIGREANIEDIGLENTDIETKDGVIVTNKWYQTKETHIYAVGDVAGGKQLAHAASKEGMIAIDHIVGNKPIPLDFHSIPQCTYSRPEIASIGLTEAEAKQRNLSVKTGVVPFQAVGRALVQGDSTGFVKMVIDKDNNDLLGIHMIGSQVTELISEAALARIVDASGFEIAETIHPHPSLSEIMGEAALAADEKAIHL